MSRALLRVVIIVVAIGYMAAAAKQFYGQRLLDYSTRESLARGTRLDPGNPLLWTAYARHLLFAGEGSEPQRSAEAYLRAASLNPFDYRNWTGLATAYLATGEMKRAESALRAGLAAVPHEPEMAWRLANLLVLEGRDKEALPFLRATIAADPTMALAAFDLGWKILSEPALILRDVVPPTLQARIQYLRFLMLKQKLVEGYDVWRQIRPEKSALVVALGNDYVEQLANAGLGAEAARVWDEILEDTGRQAAKPPGELITNGDFEAEIANAGLDWRITQGSGYEIAMDNIISQHGSRALSVTFDGSSNPEFRGVFQIVPVEPSHSYRFRGYLRTERITTLNGLSFCISSYAAPANEAFSRCSENRVGTEPWTPAQIDFQTGFGSRLVWIGLYRPVSRRLDNLIQGKVWIDNLSLQTLVP